MPVLPVRLQLSCLFALACGLVLAAGPRPARAEPWIYRPITLPSGRVELDLGFALGHVGGDAPLTGPGMNLELAFAASSSLELGVRTGGRIGHAGRVLRADEYARLFDTETYGSIADGGGFTSDPLANPEIHLRAALVRGPVLQLAFESRFFLPIEDGSRFGLMLALPLWLRIGSVRLDTGVYVPIVFTEPDTTTVVSLPLAIWIQASSRLHLGPDFGVRIWSHGGCETTTYPFGFGVGYAVGPSTDLRLRAFFRDVGGSEGARDFGLGIGFQFRT